ncbi:hypothetical protein [Niallia sp. 03133]|uniref:hypothetical protein n=1 Tax=Niallia sp. 03133 TaxID=3458060 RepID=UPI0040447F4A
MVVVQFFENKSLVLSQLLKQIPTVDEEIKIKGRKGKILSVKEIKENLFHVHLVFEKVVKTQPIGKDSKKKKR